MDFGKSFVKRGILLLLFFSLALAWVAPVHASSVEELEKESYEGLLEALPDAYEDYLGDPSDTEELTKGLSLSSLLSLVEDSLKHAFSKISGIVLSLLGIFALLEGVSTFLPPSAEEVGALAMRVGGTLFFCLSLWGSFEGFFTYLSDVAAFSGGLAPVFAGIYSAGGSGGAAVTAASGFAVFCMIAEWLAHALLSPLLRILAVIVLLSSFLGEQINELGKTVRSWVMLLFAVFSALFPAAIGFQSTLVGASDSMTARMARFAVGSSVPVVGATLSGVLGTLASSLSMMKHTVGAASFLGMLAMTLPTLIELLLLRLILSLFSNLSHAVANGALASTLDGFRGMYDLLLAATAAVTTVLFLLVAIFTHTALAIVS